MEGFSDGSSTLPASTRWTLHEHLLFQRRLCRQGVAVMSKQKARRARYLVPIPPGFYVFVDSLVHIKLYGHIVASKVKCINAHSIFLLGTMLPS